MILLKLNINTETFLKLDRINKLHVEKLDKMVTSEDSLNLLLDNYILHEQIGFFVKSKYGDERVNLQKIIVDRIFDEINKDDPRQQELSSIDKISNVFNGNVTPMNLAIMMSDLMSETKNYKINVDLRKLIDEVSKILNEVSSDAFYTEETIRYLCHEFIDNKKIDQFLLNHGFSIRIRDVITRRIRFYYKMQTKETIKFNEIEKFNWAFQQAKKEIINIGEQMKGVE